MDAKEGALTMSDEKGLQDISEVSASQMQEIHPSPEGLAALAMAISKGNRYDAITLSFNAVLHGLRFFEPELAQQSCLSLAEKLKEGAAVIQVQIDRDRQEREKPN